MIVSDIPEAIDPFLLVFMLKELLYGGMMVMRCGMGARLMILTVAVYDF